jgi:hypothetical protein
MRKMFIRSSYKRDGKGMWEKGVKEMGRGMEEQE